MFELKGRATLETPPKPRVQSGQEMILRSLGMGPYLDVVQQFATSDTFKTLATEDTLLTVKATIAGLAALNKGLEEILGTLDAIEERLAALEQGRAAETIRRHSAKSRSDRATIGGDTAGSSSAALDGNEPD